jgi:tRNA(His) guanylyltransferase
VPERDIENYFHWRQRDCTRNAVAGAAQAIFSPKRLHGKNCTEMLQMLEDGGINFQSYPAWFRNGSVITREGGVMDAPVFARDLEFLQQFLKIEEE